MSEPSSHRSPVTNDSFLASAAAASGPSGRSTIRTLHTGKDIYRSQTAAVNLELISNSEEALSVLVGTESLALAEVEKWRKRFFDALAKFSKSTSDMLSQYGVANEMLQKGVLPTLDEMEVPQLALDDADVAKVIDALAAAHPVTSAARRVAATSESHDDLLAIADRDETSEPQARAPNSPNVAAEQQQRRSGSPATPSEEDGASLESGSRKQSVSSHSQNQNNRRRSAGLRNDDAIDVTILSDATITAEAEMKLEQLVGDFGVVATRTFEDFSSLLRELRLSSSRSTGGGAMSSHARRAEIQTRLQECAHELLPLTLSRFNPVPIVLNLAAALQHDPLADTRGVLSEVQAAVAETDTTLQQKLRDRTSGAVAEHYLLVEELNEAVAGLYKKMMRDVLRGYEDVEHAAGDVREFLAQVSTIEGSLGGMEACVTQQEQMEEDAEQDIALLDQQLDSRVQRHENDAAEYGVETQRLTEELDGLRQRHGTVWAEVLEKLAELAGINEKIATARGGIEAAVSRHAARQAHHAREVQALKRLMATRKCVASSARKGAELLRATKAFASDMLQLIYKKDHESVRQRLALEQCVKFLDQYSMYAAHVQECASKKEARLENSRRLRRSINFQVEVAQSAFDPAVHRYREQLLQLSDLVEDTEAQVKALQEELHSGDMQAVWADTIRPALVARRIPFAEPLERTAHLRLEMLAKQFEAVDAFQREEQSKLDEERRVVRVMRNLVSTDKRGSVSSLARQEGRNSSSVGASRVRRTAAAALPGFGESPDASGRRGSASQSLDQQQQQDEQEAQLGASAAQSEANGDSFAIGRRRSQM